MKNLQLLEQHCQRQTNKTFTNKHQPTDFHIPVSATAGKPPRKAARKQQLSASTIDV